MTDFLFHIGQQDCLGFFCCITGDSFQFFGLSVDELIKFFFFINQDLFFMCNAFFFLFDVRNFAVQRFFLLNQSSFTALYFRTALSCISFCVGSQSVSFFLRFQDGFFFHGFGSIFSVQNQIFRLLFCTSNGFFANIFTVYISDQRTDCQCDNCNNDFYNHCNTSFFLVCIFCQNFFI